MEEDYLEEPRQKSQRNPHTLSLFARKFLSGSRVIEMKLSRRPSQPTTTTTSMTHDILKCFPFFIQESIIAQHTWQEEANLPTHRFSSVGGKIM